MDTSSICHFNIHMRCFELFQGQANANDWVAEAVKDVNMMGRSSSSGMSPVGGDSETAVTLLPILQAQRERFRQRNQELEAQNLEQQQQMALLHSEVERLRTDNVALYEKVRFLQSYSGQRATKNPAAAISSETEELYERQYEDRLDPFASFSRRERQRKLAQLGPFERITYSMGQMILSSRVARTAGVIYFSVLHLLVFLVLYRLAYTETCHRDMAAECAQKYDDHMLEAHGLHN
ncbi:hypothetical protein DAPPUDRAFT_306484 [Daphnia pulex]|uniref:CASP C-terminal domain-containing protein n=1 Tax=Daphnia pulex TaxID=6669 RepID=E9FY89_DAPPU|nr:hypothetical protein DAPPUDRAFT_306484 [Daphnia pulex]|eukprot:EFX87497.1 hypothetical protein DAPPUDRAFT_306484 [Daphnia pulex]